MRKILTISILFFIISSSFAQNGLIKIYDDNGNVSSQQFFANDILTGTSYWFFENGNLKKEITYSDGKVNGWVKEYYETGLLQLEFRVVNGIRDGLYKTYYENGGLKELRSYEGGKLIKILNIDFDPTYIAPLELFTAGNKQQESQDKDEIICDADFCPEPIGGMDKIYENLVYPEHARLYGLQGTVKLIVGVDEKGEVNKIQVFQGIGLGCEEAAAEAIKKTRFLPGRTDGKNVQTEIILNVEFKLDEDQLALVDAKNNQGTEEIKTVKNNSPKIQTNFVYSDDGDTTIIERPNLLDQNSNSENENLCDMDICPEPIGGMKAIMNNFRLPHRAKRNKDSGDIIILADVDENGYVRTTEVLNDIGHGAGLAAEVAVLDTRFNPGLNEGKAERGKVKIIITVKAE